ncbi:hypothetical protein Tco_0603632 [Tanacetum coccineum]
MRTSKYGEPNASTLEDPTLRVGNPVKEILLKLNLPDHRSNILYCKMILTALDVNVQELELEQKLGFSSSKSNARGNILTFCNIDEQLGWKSLSLTFGNNCLS